MSDIFKILALGLLGITFLNGCEAAPPEPDLQIETPVEVEAPVEVTVDAFPLFDGSRNVLSFADALDTVLPSVVRVGNLKRNSEGVLVQVGIGSGAVIDAGKGYILTNAHVVEGGDDFLITIPDGRVVSALLVGIDTPTDIAVLQADDLRVDAVSIGDSDTLRVGDLVFAVGYPLGLQESLSLGIISGLGRSDSNASLQNFIQTDAAINSGNSGGPLLDSRGYLIGVNAAIVSSGGGNLGIAYSIPSNLAIQVVNQLTTHGEVRRGAIGVEITNVSETASEKVGRHDWDGALVASVRSESAAEKAGLQAGDVIVGFDGRKVKTPSAFRAWVGVAELGKPHTLTYVRNNGIETTVEIQIIGFKAPTIESLEQLGAFVRPISAEDNVSSDIQGVYVSRIQQDSPAEHAGLQVGDVINKINRELVTSKHICDRLVSESKGRAHLLVYRHGTTLPIIIEP